MSGDLLVALRAVPGPRRHGGRRHRVEYVLGVLEVAFACAGVESFVAAAQWARGADRTSLRDTVIDSLRDHHPSSTKECSRGHARTEERILRVVPAARPAATLEP